MCVCMPAHLHATHYCCSGANLTYSYRVSKWTMHVLIYDHSWFTVRCFCFAMDVLKVNVVGVTRYLLKNINTFVNALQINWLCHVDVRLIM